MIGELALDHLAAAETMTLADYGGRSRAGSAIGRCMPASRVARRIPSG